MLTVTLPNVAVASKPAGHGTFKRTIFTCPFCAKRAPVSSPVSLFAKLVNVKLVARPSLVVEKQQKL